MAGVVRAEPGLGMLRSRLAVWGDPIAHSLSPSLHAAAYGVLGLDWTYERRRVGEADFVAALTALDSSWRGLSLTMPLKSVAFRRSSWRDQRAQLTEAVNTLLLTGRGPRGYNTDVGGIVAALRDEGVRDLPSARIVGAGATATSALVALGELGAHEVEVAARRPEAAARLVGLGERIGVRVIAVPLRADRYESRPLTIAALPGDAPVDAGIADALAAAGGILSDVVYGHWPTALSSAWESAGGRAVSGLGMLLHQALLQVRVFVGSDAELPLANEPAVLAAMRAQLVGD